MGADFCEESDENQRPLFEWFIINLDKGITLHYTLCRNIEIS